MLVVIAHLTVIAIDTEEAAAVIEAEEDIIAETTIERDRVCAREAEVQRGTRTEATDTAVAVVAETDQETVWVVAAEEIDIRLPSLM